MQELLLNIESKETRLAELKNGQLVDLVIERSKERQLTGNIYRGQVTNILHNIQSACVNINEGENGFIHISDIIENTKRFEEMFGKFNWYRQRRGLVKLDCTNSSTIWIEKDRTDILRSSLNLSIKLVSFILKPHP